MATRKKYTKEFKQDAVRLVTEQGYNQSEVARNLGIDRGMLGRWVNEAREAQTKSKKRGRNKRLSTVNPNAAAIDVGSQFHVVAVPADRDDAPVRSFQSFTRDLHRLADWYAVLGVDLTQIHGIGPSLALKLLSECGTDMSKWPTAKHFTSWLCVTPRNKISGGKGLSAHTRRSKNRATALLRLAAVNVGKTDSALGAFYRRPAARVGKAKAATATARKLAILFYNTLRYGVGYSDRAPPTTRSSIALACPAQPFTAGQAARLYPRAGLRGGSFLGSDGLLRERVELRFQFIAQEKKAYPVTLLCRMLGVNRSGFYDYLRRQKRDPELERKKMLEWVKDIAEASDHTYGSRRMAKALRALGYPVGRHHARSLMREAGVWVRYRRRYRATTDSNHRQPVFENRLERNFEVDAADHVYAGDITYVWTQEGWLYLAVVIDLYSRKVVGWSMGRRLTSTLVCDALRMAPWGRQPPKGQLIHHSDRGVQYASDAFGRLRRSMASRAA
jgi:putative transposase